MRERADTGSVLEQELTLAKHNLESEKSRCSILEQELSQTETSLQAEQGRLTSLELELNSMRAGSYGESDRCSALEKELTVLEQTAKELQIELGCSQHELEQALELCGEHEAVIEERNRELSSLEETLR